MSDTGACTPSVSSCERVEAILDRVRTRVGSEAFDPLLRLVFGLSPRAQIEAEMKRLEALEYENMMRGESLIESLEASLFRLRHAAIHQIGFALPCSEAIETIVRHARASAGGRLLEVGAGTGFFAHLLSRAGLDVVATDKGENAYGFCEPWLPIVAIDALSAIAAYPDRDLLLSWPCYQQDWGEEAIAALASGRLLFHIGEDAGGCTGTDALFDRLERDFVYLERVYLPNWPGIHDCLDVYRKT